MKVVICEDHPQQRKLLHTIIKNYAMMNHPSVEIALVASDAEQVLSYLENNKADCYFLDIELGDGSNGIQLADAIRKNDLLASIIFVTNYSEALKLTFKYKLAALDYIIKSSDENFSEEIIGAFESAVERYEKLGQTKTTNVFQIKMGELIKNVPYENIYYFETSEDFHKIRLYEKNGVYDFYGKLKDIEEIDSTFFRCHKSCVINLQHIIEINKKDKYVKLVNGAKCTVSFRAMRNIISKVNESLVKIE